MTHDEWCSQLAEVRNAVGMLRQTLPTLGGYVEVPNTLREIESTLLKCRVEFQQQASKDRKIMLSVGRTINATSL